MENDTLQFQDIRDKTSLLADDNEDQEPKLKQNQHTRRQSTITQSEYDSNDQQGEPVPDGSRIYEFEYWQRYFDVESREVAERLVRSFLPTRKHVLGELLNAKPDFYGPFWSIVTLIFLLGVSTNVRNYFAQAAFERHGAVKTSEDEFQFEYDFQLVPVAIALIVAYFTVIGIVETFVVKCLHVSIRFRFSALVCAHGYALSPFNLVAIAWLLNEAWLAWLVMIIFTLLSGAPLVRTLRQALEPSPGTQTGQSERRERDRQANKNESEIVVNVNLNDGLEPSRTSWLTIEKLRPIAVPVTLTTVSVLHATLAISFMFVFFYR